MDGTTPLVLLIEDEPQMRRFLRTALESNDYRLVEAGTAKEGLAHAAARNPDVILLDLGLPDRDGLEVALPEAGQAGHTSAVAFGSNPPLTWSRVSVTGAS